MSLLCECSANTRATEMEIMAALIVFGVTIYTYNTDRWNIYTDQASDVVGISRRRLTHRLAAA